MRQYICGYATKLGQANVTDILFWGGGMHDFGRKGRERYIGQNLVVFLPKTKPSEGAQTCSIQAGGSSIIWRIISHLTDMLWVANQRRGLDGVRETLPRHHDTLISAGYPVDFPW